MPVEKLPIENFIETALDSIVLDVRSPAEYAQAHFPGAYSLPLFSDEERKVIGTAYKKQSREVAIKFGLDYFGPKMRRMVEEVETLVRQKNKQTGKNDNTVFVHCWRGGMRSSAVAWLLSMYGFNVQLLEGGYKSYRNWVLQQLEKDYSIRIVGGYTGSGKTPIIHALKSAGQTVIDLEGLASHKGSAFGALGQPSQPRQEMFENMIAQELYVLTKSNSNQMIWMEDESQRIGVLNIPVALWNTMRTKPVHFLDIPFEERLDYITKEYGLHDKEKLVNAIIRIQKRLGPLETKTAIGHLIENDYKESFRILLNYYDKLYIKALHNRENVSTLLNKIPCSAVDSVSNVKTILACEPVSVPS